MTPYIQDSDFTLYHCDVLDGLRALPDESVHCVVTSPPYWGLRDYGTGWWDGGDPDCDHTMPSRGDPAISRASSTLGNWKSGGGALASTGHAQEPSYRDVCGRCGARRVDHQLGLEPTPDAYIARMVQVFREVRRVLRRDGTCWVNMGDSYASADTYKGAGGSGGKQATHPGSFHEGRVGVPAGLKPKDLVGIPWRLAFALQADGWYLRSDIIWSKPNPMPESVTDRPTKAHEYVFLLTREPRYFFDQEAVREKAEWARWGAQNGAGKYGGTESKAAMVQSRTKQELQKKAKGSGRNVRSVWEIATQPYPEAHFATFPEELVRRCILAGTSERGCCPECGKPWERETESYDAQGRTTTATLGWRPGCEHREVCPDCDGSGLECNWCSDTGVLYLPSAPCTVLDPFLGSGTTALVARKHGRRSIGIELNPEYCELAARRLAQQSLFAGAD